MDGHITSADGATPGGIPDQLAPGLDLFAAAWLESFLKAGGDVWVSKDGKTQLGWQPYRDGPTFHEPSVALPDELRESSITFSDGRHTGMLGALFHLLDTVPYGRDALKAHLVAHGIRYLSGRQELKA